MLKDRGDRTRRRFVKAPGLEYATRKSVVIGRLKAFSVKLEIFVLWAREASLSKAEFYGLLCGVC